MAELKRVLGFWTILCLSIGSIMGTGLFFGTSIGAHYAGNGAILAWIILTAIAIYISTFFGELVSMYPSAGGIYEFSKHAYSKFFSFMMGWLAWIVGNLTTALLVVAAIDYLLPSSTDFWIKMGISVALIVMLNLVAYFGIEQSGFIIILLTALTLGTFAAIIFPGALHINEQYYFPFTVKLSVIAVAIFFLTESFFGWESATYLAEETKDPEKVIPRALVMGTLLVGIIGISLTIVSFGVIPWSELAKSNAPLSDVAKILFGDFGKSAINVGIFAALIGSAAGGIVTMPRLILALARDKLFIAQFSDVHSRFRTPYKAIIFQAIVSIAVFAIVVGSYDTLLSTLLPLALLMYIFTILTVPILRITEKELKRSFKVPFVALGSFATIGFIVFLIASWVLYEPGAIKILMLGASLLSLGIPIFLLLEVYYNPAVIVRINDALAYATLMSEMFILPPKVRREIVSLLGDIRGKRVLEFGCSVGTLTVRLADEVKPGGKVYATDLSKQHLAISKWRMKNRGHSHVVFLHDEHQINRVHPSVPLVDAVISMGMMGYLQDVKKVLLEIRELLPYNGRIVFVDYVDYFKVLPNVPWLSNDKMIEKIFREAGFSVFVTRKKGLLWNYVYVYGIKFHENVPFI